jgi:uncharacterized protein YraI
LILLLTPAVNSQDATPAPTPNAAVALAPKLIIQGAAINVRGGPGLAYAVIGKATKGQQYTITGRDAKSTWWQVDFRGKPDWMAASLVKVPPKRLSLIPAWQFLW